MKEVTQLSFPKFIRNISAPEVEFHFLVSLLKLPVSDSLFYPKPSLLC